MKIEAKTPWVLPLVYFLLFLDWLCELLTGMPFILNT